jgi:D-alanyl-D-alanine carboxypeptidase/D-alanyl-D-alanine-endopeptidase (penicillin-binding protein 4)
MDRGREGSGGPGWSGDRPRHMAGGSGRSRRTAPGQGRRDPRPLPVPPDPMDGAAGPRTGRSRRASTERTTGEWPTPVAPRRRPEPRRIGDEPWTIAGVGADTGADRDRARRSGVEEPPRRRGWILPALLGVAAVGAAVGSVVLNQDDVAEAAGVTDATTPVLSARRAPEMIAAPVADRRLTADLQAWVGGSSPSTCLVVTAGNRPLFRHNPEMPLVGASTQKLVTATALLLAHSPDDRLTTVAGTTAPPAAGVVAGDLYLVGGGDPTLATPGYVGSLPHGQIVANDPAKLADAIKAAGITRIEGGIVGDDSRYDGERFTPAWPTRFHGTQVGSVSALSVDDSNNTLGLDPPPADPATNAAAVLRQLLIDRGVQVGGAARSGAAPADLTKVAELPSPTVREIVAEMLTESDNDTAEMSFKEIGLQKGGAGSWAAGATAVNMLLADAGVPLQGTRIVEGSGLSSDNRVTCSMIVNLLTRPETGPVVVDGLAVAGETGTLQDRFEGSAAEGRLRAKTGTLNQVTALSGRVDTLQGGTLTFSYITNAVEGDTIDGDDVERQTGLADILVRYPRGVDLTVLLPAAVPGAPAGGAPAAGGTGGAASTTSVPPTAPPAQ